jgi:hypothetical protein
MEQKTINLTQELHSHMAAIYINASSDLDFLIKDSPNYYRKAEMLEVECFMLSHILLELRVISEGYLKRDSDYNKFGKIFLNLYDNYLGDCIEIGEELALETVTHLEVIDKRVDVYKNLYFNKGPLEIAQMFFNILFSEIETMQIYREKGVSSVKQKMDMKSFGILSKLFRNVFMVVELFFKDGITAYLKNELNPSEEFKKKAQNYLFKKYLE